MITELEISGLGVIDHARVELDPGFTVFTGETGAGKTMIVTGLGLLLGGRADQGAIRVGESSASVTGRFSELPDTTAARVDDAGGELDGSELIMARRLTSSRSRSWLGGAQVPASTSADVAATLVTIHGQSGQAQLARTERQRELLDRHGGAELAAVLEPYLERYRRLRACEQELDELRTTARERQREIDLLRFGLSEIAAVDPQPGEDDALAAEAHRLQSVDDLRLQAQTALAALAGTLDVEAPDALALAGEARRGLEHAREDDPELAPIVDQLTGAVSVLADVAADLSRYLDTLDADPLRLEQVMTRRADLTGLTRKYGTSIDEVLTWRTDSQVRLATLSGSDDRIDELDAEAAAIRDEVATLATLLTDLRRQAADDLATRVGDELTALAMPHARLIFELTPLPEPGPHGADQVQLLFTANPGSAPAPLAKVASGGELSRVRLALEVVLAGHGDAQTYVFDEVDAGVGGAVAVEIGRRLARLAADSQVIVVTHLAQVAAFADRHFVVAKSDDGQVTTSGVGEVSGETRATELARMMAGLGESASAQAHADELLRLAADTTPAGLGRRPLNR